MSRTVILLLSGLLMLSGPSNATPTVGAAPKGDAAVVASRIIKQNFPSCQRVTAAVRAPDGSIRAKCSGSSFTVFTLYDPDKRKMHEVAMNCSMAKELLNVDC